MTIATSNTRDRFPLSPKKIIKKTLVASISWIVLLGVLSGFLGLSTVAVADQIARTVVGSLALGLLVLLAAIVAVTYFYQRWYYAVYFYDLTPDYVVIRKGPITPREITIPYERIQDVYVDQDILDRLFGIYDVHLSSATVSSGTQAHIDGVDKAAADGLKMLLLETVSSKIGKKKS
jgi:membrane protein YdbS with pleckstrin-like domain